MPKALGNILDGNRIDDWSIDPDVETDSYLDLKAGVIRLFSDRKAFLNWLKDAGTAQEIQGAIRKRDELRRQHEAMGDRQKAALESQQITDFTTKQRAVRGLLRRRGVSAEEYKGLLRLHEDGALGSMVVYDSPGCVGDWAYFPPGAYPRLSWLGWNDRISSFYNLGMLASLHRHTWFRGATLWVPVFARYKDLGWWNNRISSMIFYS